MKSFCNWYTNDIHHPVLLCVPEEAESTRPIQWQLFGFVRQGLNIRMVSKGNEAVPRKHTRISVLELQRRGVLIYCVNYYMYLQVHVLTSERLNSSFWQVSSKVRQSDPKQHLFHSSQPEKQRLIGSKTVHVVMMLICLQKGLLVCSYSSTYWDTW